MGADNVISLDLSSFTQSDISKIKSLGEKQTLLYRWFRCERKQEAGLDQYMIYSGTRSQTPYAAYRIERRKDGSYHLMEQRTDTELVCGRNMDDIINQLPDDFYYSV